MNPARIPKVNRELPLLSWEQKALMHRLLADDFGVSWDHQMEIAGGAAAELCRDLFLKGHPQDKSVVVLVGRGFNAGVALTCARRLHAWGTKVRIWHGELPPAQTDFTSSRLTSLQRMGILAVDTPKFMPALILDGLLDFGKDTRSLPYAAEMVFWANTSICPVLSIEIPSGTHPDSGSPLHAPVLRASATLALGLPYKGLLNDRARPHAGEIYLADIGIPPSLWSAPGLVDLNMKESLFSEANTLKIR